MDNKDKNIKKQIREQTVGYITAAFGLVVGLSWNDAIKALIDSFFPLGNGGLIAKFIYAGALTILLVLATNYTVSRFSNKD